MAETIILKKKMEQNSEIIIYTSPDGTTKLQVQLEDETVWLTQDQMAMLFGKANSKSPSIPKALGLTRKQLSEVTPPLPTQHRLPR